MRPGPGPAGPARPEQARLRDQSRSATSTQFAAALGAVSNWTDVAKHRAGFYVIEQEAARQVRCCPLLPPNVPPQLILSAGHLQPAEGHVRDWPLLTATACHRRRSSSASTRCA